MAGFGPSPFKSDYAGGNYSGYSQGGIDRFGRPYKLKRTKVNKNGYEYASVQIGNKWYRIEFSECNKEKTKDNHGSQWCKVTQLPDQKKTRTAGF